MSDAISMGTALAAADEEIEALEVKIEELRTALADLIGLAEVAMRHANRAGGEFDVDGELAEPRAIVDSKAAS